MTNGSSDPAVLIAGGGLGGLAAAVALARRGVKSHLVERADDFLDTSAGIQLGPNAVHVLERLGLTDAVRPNVVAPQGIRIHDGLTGQCMAVLPLGEHAVRRYGAPYWVIQRGDLRSVLAWAAEADPNVKVTLGFDIDAIRLQDGAVSLASKDGRVVSAPALIGADGVRSVVRSHVLEDGLPAYTGYTIWRALLDIRQVRPPFSYNAIGLWLAPGAHLVHYPVSGGSTLNIVAVVEDNQAGEGWSAPGDAGELMDRFNGWADGPLRLLKSVPQWLTRGLYCHGPKRGWSRGPVTLLGDAAHPMVPFLAQGAVMALEDAAVLASLVAKEKSATAAFRAYEKTRFARTARVQRKSLRLGPIYHTGGIRRSARNAVLKKRTGEGLLNRNSWLYQWEMPAG